MQKEMCCIYGVDVGIKKLKYSLSGSEDSLGWIDKEIINFVYLFIYR